MQEEKKAKTLSISAELYQMIQKEVLGVFKKKSDLHKSDEI